MTVDGKSSISHHSYSSLVIHKSTVNSHQSTVNSHQSPVNSQQSTVNSQILRNLHFRSSFHIKC
ncbi:MAG: hypothetical protein KME64_08940 [Scytonematopsis contorta HA4267-MV1]|nr:hypothetical protein [Scytonematopsis contorta HA4267-MV1]